MIEYGLFNDESADYSAEEAVEAGFYNPHGIGFGVLPMNWYTVQIGGFIPDWGMDWTETRGVWAKNAYEACLAAQRREGRTCRVRDENAFEPWYYLPTGSNWSDPR